MHHEGSLHVLSRLLRGEGRVGLLALSGGARGVYGGAQASALEKYHLHDKFAVLAGVSTGAATVLYFAEGIASRGHRIYFEECTTRRYMSRSPMRILRGTCVDLDYLCSIFRGEVGNNPACVPPLRACRPEVVVGVTDYETGEGVLIDAKTATPDPVAAVHASIAMPHVYRKPVYVNGRRWLDGAGGIPFPAKQLIEQWGLDGLIVLANRPQDWQRTLKRKALEFLAFNTLPAGPRRSFRRRLEVFAENLAYLRNGTVPYLILWTGDEVEIFNQDAALLKQVAQKAYRYMDNLLISAGA